MTWIAFDEGELHDAVFAQPLFLVQPIIPYGGIAMLHGPKTAGKTQFALTLGIAVRYGEPFLGEYPCREGPVVLLETDMTKQTLQARARLAPRTRGLRFVLADPFDVVRIATLPAFEPLASLQALAPALLIVDSLRKTTVGRDEQESGTPALVYTAWRKLFPETTIMLIHHDRKKPTMPHSMPHMDEAARGSSAWLDDCDTGLHLTRMHETRTGETVATLSFSKCRTMEEPQPMSLRMLPDTLLLEPTKPTTRQRLLAWLAANPAATREAAIEFLLRDGKCSRSLVYRLVAEEVAK